jgi:hypothetical protein
MYLKLAFFKNKNFNFKKCNNNNFINNMEEHIKQKKTKIFPIIK